MALISTQTLTLKSPLNLSLPSHPSSQSFSLSPSTPHSSPPTARFSARRLGLSRATTSSALDFSPSIGEVLGEVGIFTAAGDPVRFNDLLDQNEGIVVVALLRHFGCVCCWELASALKESKARFDSAGVKLIAVGVGTPDKARILAERLPFPMDSLYADPDRKAYDVLGLYFGLGRTFFNPASAKVFSRIEALQKALKNYTIKATPDDINSVLQQGGMFVFKGKQLLYARKDEGTGDHAPLDDIFDVCCKVPVS
ncbi:putative thioredoxin-like, peroxiredoxin-like FAM213/AAED1 [Rosa chinensis]|uniref:Putative thioredoxin-like, peroxiredoxin-like FAM213/AAED1 n=1 Tax=Rosa chinensis TaxID=74649 RepID=A0A2P6RPD4_ROSCH|nr:thioredoxin-like protein AAED1, chloroplastic [Rosa chinensis]PRQ48261.1 putative thioredoxin-like, peroxiredoxin-like FAM213/AAED1 [Rosa chinensis]